MPEVIKQTGSALMDSLLYWKLAIFQVAGKAVMTLILQLASTLNGSEWSDYSATQKFVQVALAGGQAWLVIEAFLSTTIRDLQDDLNGDQQPPNPNA